MKYQTLAVRIPFLLPIMLLMLVACRDKRPPASTSPPQVEVITARVETVQPTIDSWGIVTPIEKVEIHPAIEGTIQEVLVEIGDQVKAGASLARLKIDHLIVRREQAEAERATRQAKFALAEQSLQEGRRTVATQFIMIDKARQELEQRRVEHHDRQERYQNKQRLFEIGGIASEQIKSARVQYLESQTKLRQAEHDLAIRMIGFRDVDLLDAGFMPMQDPDKRQQQLIALNTSSLEADMEVSRREIAVIEGRLKEFDLLLEQSRLRSPFDGVVATRTISRGQQVHPDRIAFTIIGERGFYLQVEVSERELAALRLNDRAHISWERAPYHSAGRIKIIEPYVKQQSGAATVHIAIVDPPPGIITGMFARVRIDIGATVSGIAVPNSALIPTTGNSQAVYVIRDGRALHTEVTVLHTDAERVTLSDGVAPGDMVVREATLITREGVVVTTAP